MPNTTIIALDQVYDELKKREVNITDIYSFVHPKKTKNKTINMSLGRCWINLILPDVIPLISEVCNKKKLNQMCNLILEKLSSEEAANAMTILNKESFKMSSILPVTFDIDACITPDSIIAERNIRLTKDTPIEDFAPTLSNISEKYLNDQLSDTGIGQIIKSGAKGSATDFGVLTIAKGATIDIEGNISEPILSALTEGYTGKEYYAAGAEARRSLYIRGVGTAKPGHLARTVTFANANILIDPNKDDCGTKKYFELFVKPTMINGLFGRWMYNDHTGALELITKDTKIVNKKINLRSPLFCKSKVGICKTCYGQLCDKLDTKHIGLVAGAAINSAGIEGYAMKARHQSVQVKLKPVNFIVDLL